MSLEKVNKVLWQKLEVTSPCLSSPVTVIAAKGMPYVSDANHLQTLNLSLPDTPESKALIGTPATFLPGANADAVLRYCVHIHGGA